MTNYVPYLAYIGKIAHVGGDEESLFCLLWPSKSQIQIVWCIWANESTGNFFIGGVEKNIFGSEKSYQM